ncbi:MAG: alpha/beta fold hydrolase [Gammaproteobacteria bacterium]|nr:alpha/beta fold hydrolase [Gammaproteobacteria bacterium]
MKKTIFLFLVSFISTLSINAKQFDPVTMDLPEIDKEFPPKFHEIFIPVDGIQLTGFILTANGKGPHPTAVLIHGLPGNEKNLDIAQSLRRAGFNVLFFHYRGSWGSQGDYSFLPLHTDAIAALDFLRNNAKQYQVDTNNLSIIGHSFGGYAALRAASEQEDLSCAVAISAANPAVIANSKRVDDSFEANIGNYMDTLFMLRNYPGKKAIADLKANSKIMDTRLFGEKLKGKKVYMIVGKQDTVTPPQLQIDNYNSYSKVKGLEVESVMIEGDHAYSISRMELQHKIVNWMMGNCGG